jgi:mRNA interferase RelE/StbE
MHEVLLERAAQRDLRKLAPDIFRRVVDAIRALAAEPRPPGCRKISGSRSDYRIRIGTIRVIYEIDDRVREVRIMRVKHRREAYR